MAFIVFFSVLIVTLNSYVVFATWNHFGDGQWGLIWRLFLGFMVVWEVTTLFIMYYQFRPDYGKTSVASNLFMGVTMTFLASKLIFIVFLLGNDIYRLIRWPIESVISDESVSFESRRKFISNIGLVAAAIPFTGLLYGTLKGRYSYKVWKQKLTFNDLPESFNGLRIAQLSDIHSGSLDNPEAVRDGLRELMSYKPDMILLTGDLVNNFATEIDDYVDIFREELRAPLGMYAVMGNHDYGEYVQWKSEEDRLKNINDVMDRYRLLGFDLLNNESRELEVNGESIQLLGVENWGGGGFPKYGDFDKAIENVASDSFKILMSHDPDHWGLKVLDHEVHVNLTLSGHTHGSQMGIEIPGWVKWSPVKYRYKRWAGLYQEKDQYLYVNRGFGFIGYPGRIGIWPEITIFTLERE
ncbi:MAG: metallophosphoesterase [bacterium]|nr:metallophosphoesterase [bacterium]